MEMEVLHQNGTWEQVAFLPSKKTIGCKWVYTVKFNLDGSVERLKGHSVAKGYTKMYGIDYDDRFSPVAKISYIHVVMFIGC
jgi:hypothetical protein